MARRLLGLALTAAGATAVLGLGIGLAAAPALAAPAGPLDAATTLDAAVLADSTSTDGTTPGPKGDPLVLRLQRACDRIPNLLTRSQNLQTRLAADASTRGSIAHLQARIAAAQAAGKTDLVTALQNRLKVRQDLQAILPARIEELKKAQSGICVDVAAATGSK